MSYDFIVYVRRDSLPDAAAVSRELALRAPGIEIPGNVDFGSTRGYVPISDSGFELTRSDITMANVESHRNLLRQDNEPDDDRIAILLASDMRITFRCRDGREIDVAKLVAGAVAKLANGYISNPQMGLTIRADYLPD